MQHMNSSLPTVTLEQRLALIWVHKHQPTPFGSSKDPNAPPRRAMVDLVRLGLIHFAPERKPFDPPIYSVTPTGREVLGK